MGEKPLKAFLEFVTILFQFYVLVFWPQGMWALCPRPGVKPTPPALEGEALSTRQPGKSLFFLIYPREWTQSTGPEEACAKHYICWILGPPGPLSVERVAAGGEARACKGSKHPGGGGRQVQGSQRVSSLHLHCLPSIGTSTRSHWSSASVSPFVTKEATLRRGQIPSYDWK